MALQAVHWRACVVASASTVGGWAGVVLGGVPFTALSAGRGFVGAYHSRVSESAEVAAMGAWAKGQVFGQAVPAVADE